MTPQDIKSVHITNYYHKNSGGISTSFNNLLAAAGRHQRHVRLIVPGEVETIEEVNEFAKIYYVPAKYSPVFDKRYRVMMPWHYMRSESPIRKILLAEMPDIIEVTDKYTLSLIGAMIRTNNFKRLGRPILVHFSCERMDDNVESFLLGGSIGRWLSRRIVGNYLMPSFDFHIANSEYTAEEFRQSTLPASNDRRSKFFFNKCWQWLKSPRIDLSQRIIVCPRGVDSVLFTPDRRSEKIRVDMCRRASIPESSVVMLYAGRISPEKNIGLLVDTMKELTKDATRDFRLIVAGAGPLSDELRERSTREADGRIIQIGHLEKKTLADFYANADVFVHPNPKEPFGIAPLEAMASGVPTVAPNSGGILSYATESNAWLTEPNGPAFAKAILRVLDDDPERLRKVTEAVATARANTREIATDRLFDAYDRIFEVFHTEPELFTDVAASRSFDYTVLLDD